MSAEHPITVHSQGQYEIWADLPEAQKDIYEITVSLCNYLKDNEIRNLLLVDSAARPAWIAVTTYWRRHFPDTPRPYIYFVNPMGIKPSASETNGLVIPTDEAQCLIADKWGKGFGYEEGEIRRVRTEREILEEFPQRYPQ